MREIKFRAFDGGRIVKVNTIRWTDGEIDWVDTSKNDDFDQDLILMQYTGMKDVKGVEIYEGDILKCTSRIYTNLGATVTGEYEETIKQVIWKDDSWGTRIISSNLTSKGAEKSGLVISAKYAEVIGNIYQNKQLLED